MSYQGPPWQPPTSNRYYNQPGQPRQPQQSRPRPPKKKHSFWFWLFFGLFILCFHVLRVFFVLWFRMLLAFWRWYSKQTRRTQVIVGAVIAIVLVIGGIANALSASSQSASIPAPTPTVAQAQVVDQPTQDTSLLDTPTDQPTVAPTVAPTMKPTPKPTQKPTPRPTQPPPKPTSCPGINCNPWGYNFSPGNLIYNPPSNFCDYFNCIASFWGSDDPGDGYVNQCVDGTYSQSGGERGDCSYHGGEGRPLYSH